MENSNESTKPELNTFLKCILYIRDFGTAILTIRVCVMISAFSDFATTFCVINCINAAIHIWGIIIILTKKRIEGFYIIIGNYILLVPIAFIVNIICNYNVFNVQAIFIETTIQLIILPLLFSLRKNGISAYKALKSK